MKHSSQWISIIGGMLLSLTLDTLCQSGFKLLKITATVQVQFMQEQTAVLSTFSMSFPSILRLLLLLEYTLKHWTLPLNLDHKKYLFQWANGSIFNFHSSNIEDIRLRLMICKEEIFNQFLEVTIWCLNL